MNPDIPGYTIRPTTLGDARAVFEIFAAVGLKLGGQMEDTLDTIVSSWTRPNYNISESSQVAINSDGKLIGYAAVYDALNAATPGIDLYIHADFWGTDDRIEPALLAWIEARVAQNVGKIPADYRLAMRTFIYTHDERYADVLVRAGFEPNRFTLRMVIDLDAPPDVPPLPDGITFATSQADDDWKPIVAAYREIWRDHWGYVEQSFEVDYERWRPIREHGFRPGYWMLAMDGDQIAGMVISEDNFNEDTDWGYVVVVGVKREYRRKGLAMGLLKRAFAKFYEDGRHHACLYVDAGSLTGATRLYEAAGMRQGLSYTTYEKVLRPGFDPSTRELEQQA